MGRKSTTQFPVDINFVNPGLCHSELACESGWRLDIMKFFIACNTESGRWNLVHAAFFGPRVIWSIHQRWCDCAAIKLRAESRGSKGPTKSLEWVALQDWILFKRVWWAVSKNYAIFYKVVRRIDADSRPTTWRLLMYIASYSWAWTYVSHMATGRWKKVFSDPPSVKVLFCDTGAHVYFFW